MAQKRDNRMIIRAMPWRQGLLTAGQQTTIDETAMWQAQDTTAELDGLLGKRPGLRQWGQIIKQPDVDAAGSTFNLMEAWSSLSAWLETDASTGLIDHTVLTGSVRTTVAPGSSNETMSLALPGTSATGELSARFSVRLVDAPAYTALATVPNTLAVRLGDTTGKEFAFHSGGIYYKLASDDTYSLIADSDGVANGGWHLVEITMSATAINVYLDETLLTTTALVPAVLKDETLIGTGNITEFRWETEGGGTDQYTTELGPLMLNDVAADGFETKEVRGISDFRYINIAGSTQRVMLAAAGDYVYHDNGLQGHWRVLLSTQYVNTFFAPFRRTILIVDYSDNVPSNVWQWNGTETPTTLSDAPNLKLVTEHKQRVWGAGDTQNPLRAYFSGDRQSNLWFSPSPENIEDQIDAIEQAGYLEIPSKKGDAIVAMFGDFYGRLLIFSRRGVWQVGGDGPASFTLQAVSQDVGCENSDCVTQVGNDIWFLGRNGIHSLSTVQQFGDIAASFPSAPISDLWGQNPSASKHVVRDYLHRSRLKYNPTQGLVYAAMPTTGQTTPNTVYIYNVNNQQWYGPWQIDSRAMENIEISPPAIEVMAHGGEDGRVLFTDQGSRKDVDTAIAMKIESAYLNGRSLDPILPAMMKTWKVLRLFVLPRGEWDINFTWRTDTDVKKTDSRSQNTFKSRVLGLDDGDPGDVGDFRLDIDEYRSREEMGVIEIKLDSRGYSLRFIIEQSGLGEDLVIQGFEVEFTADGYEVE